MQNFATTTPITAVLDIPAGRIRIAASERADVTVEVRPADAAKGRDARTAERTEVTFTEGVLRIATAPAENRLIGHGSVEVVVGLPTGSHVQGKTGAAELRTTGRLGEVSFDGAYRDIQVDEVASLRLTAVDGDVEVSRLHGAAEISTTRGSIRVAEAHRGTVVLATQSGDLTICAARGSSAALDASTAHGRISNALQNDGTTVLDIRATTSDGDITARSL